MCWLCDKVQLFGSYCLDRWIFKAHAYIGKICIDVSKEIIEAQQSPTNYTMCSLNIDLGSSCITAASPSTFPPCRQLLSLHLA